MSAPCPDGARGPGGPKIQILSCEPRYVGSARYLLTIGFGCFCLSGVVVLRQGDEWWTALPTRHKLSNGKAQPRKGGGYITEPILEIPDERHKRHFDAAVMAALTIHLSTQEAS